MYHIFLETSVQIQLIDGDTSYHDRHQDSQDDQGDQECPPRKHCIAWLSGSVAWLSGNAAWLSGNAALQHYRPATNNLSCLV